MGHVDVARAGGRGPYWYVHWVFASRDALADSETQNRLKIAKLRILRSILLHVIRLVTGIKKKDLLQEIHPLQTCHKHMH